MHNNLQDNADRNPFGVVLIFWSISIADSVYPELVALVGSRAPDYRGRFLRGLQSGHSVGEAVTNTLKNHNHTQPSHTHSFSGQLVSTALSGTAAGQSFSASASLSVSGSASGQTITSGGAGGQSFSYQGSTATNGGYFVLSQNVGHSRPTYYATKANGSAQGGGIYLSRTSDDGNSDTVYVPIGTSSTSMTDTTSGGAIWGSTGGGSISGTANGTVARTANASTVSGNLRNGNVSGAIGAEAAIRRIIPETRRQPPITSTSAVLFERSHDLPKFPELLILKTERARVQVTL